MAELPDISFEKALLLFRSTEPDDCAVGMNVLFRHFVNRNETWDAFLNYLVERPQCDISPVLIYYLAHISWHPDIVWTGAEPISPQTREYAKKLFRERIGRQEVIKLLDCIDEHGASRGSVGQSVVAIISCLNERGPILAGIARDRSLPIATRESAALIIAMREGRDAIPILMELARSGSEKFAWELVSPLRQNGRL